MGVPWWPSRLRSKHCHCYGSGHYWDAGLIPGPKLVHAVGAAKKKKMNHLHEDPWGSRIDDGNLFAVYDYV